MPLARPLSVIAILMIVSVVSSCQRSFTDEELLAKARAFVQDENFSAAVIEFKNVLQQNPGNADARTLLGKTYLSNGNAIDAEKELSYAIRLGASDPTIQLDLFQSYLELGRFEEIEKQLVPEDFSGADNSSRAYAIAAGAYIGLEKYLQGDELYEQSLAIKDNVDARVGLIESALRAGQIMQVSQLIKDAMEVYSDDFKLNFVATRSEIQARNYDSALAYISKALEQRWDLKASLVKAELLLAEGETSLAEAEIEQALKLVPSSIGAEFVKGKIKYQQKDYAAAQDLLEHVLASDSDHKPTLFLLGSIYELKGQTVLAQKRLQRFNVLAPDSVVGAKLLARIYLKQRQHGAVENILLPLLKAHPEDSQLIELAAAATVGLGKLVEAKAFYQTLVRLQPESAKAKNYLGAILYALGETDEGIAAMEEAVAADPGQVEARMILMQGYLTAKEYARAQGLAEAILEAEPESTVGWNYLGLISQRQGNNKVAKEFYAKALELDDSDPDANAQLASISRNDGALDQAQAYYDQIYKKYPNHLATRIANSALHVQRQDNNAAIGQLEIATRAHPEDLRSNLLLATYYIRYGQYKDGVRVTSALRRRYSTNVSVFPVLAEALLRWGHWSSALEELKDWARLEPQSPNVYALKAYALMQAKQYPQAQEALDNALGLDSKNLRALLEQSRFHILQENYNQAKKVLARLEKAFPDNSLIAARAGDLAFARGDFETALTLFRKATVSPADSELIGSLGKALWKVDKQTEALATWQGWLKTFPNDLATRYLLAQMHRLKGDHALANTELMTMLEQDRKNPQVLNELAWYLKDQQLAKAKTYASEAHDLVPGNPQIADTLAVILMLEGNIGESIYLLQSATVKAPDDLDIHFHYAQALAANRANQEAEAVLTTLLETESAFEERAEAVALLAKVKAK